LKRISFKNVYVIYGGFSTWKTNYPDAIEKSSGEEAEEDDGCGLNASN